MTSFFPLPPHLGEGHRLKNGERKLPSWYWAFIFKGTIPNVLQLVASIQNQCFDTSRLHISGQKGRTEERVDKNNLT